MLALLVVYFCVYSFYLFIKCLRLHQSCSLSHPFWQLTQKFRLIDKIATMKLQYKLEYIFSLFTLLLKMKRIGPDSSEKGSRFKRVGSWCLWYKIEGSIRIVLVEQHLKEKDLILKWGDSLIGMQQIASILKIDTRLLLKNFEHKRDI